MKIIKLGKLEEIRGTRFITRAGLLRDNDLSGDVSEIRITVGQVSKADGAVILIDYSISFEEAENLAGALYRLLLEATADEVKVIGSMIDGLNDEMPR